MCPQSHSSSSSICKYCCPKHVSFLLSTRIICLRLTLLLLMCMLSAQSTAWALQIRSLDGNSTFGMSYFPSPRFATGNSSFLVSGVLVKAHPDKHGCTLDQTMKGKLVFIKSYFCSFEAKIVECGRVSCLGLIEHHTYYTVAGYSMWGWLDTKYSRADLHVPMVELSKSDGDEVEELMQMHSVEVRVFRLQTQIHTSSYLNRQNGFGL